MQTLFQVDVGKIDADHALAYVCQEFAVNDVAAAYARELVDGVLANRGPIDETISRLAVEWSIERMPHVDRNLLRIAVHEMTDRTDIPPNVAINEALELAKIYAGDESVRFINGILGQLVRERRLEAEALDDDEASNAEALNKETSNDEALAEEEASNTEVLAPEALKESDKAVEGDVPDA